MRGSYLWFLNMGQDAWRNWLKCREVLKVFCFRRACVCYFKLTSTIRFLRTCLHQLKEEHLGILQRSLRQWGWGYDRNFFKIDRVPLKTGPAHNSVVRMVCPQQRQSFHWLKSCLCPKVK